MKQNRRTLLGLLGGLAAAPAIIKPRAAMASTYSGMPYLRVYAGGAGQLVDQPPNVYSRSEPFRADTIRYDKISVTGLGCWDTTNFCYVAYRPHAAEFRAQLLFWAPRSGGQANVWFMLNVLPPPDGTVGGEAAGDDVTVWQPSNVNFNVSCRVERILELAAGDRVWCVPGSAGGGQLTQSIAGNGNDTTNFVEVKVLGAL